MSNSDGRSTRGCSSARTDLEHRKFRRHADPQRKAVEARPAMDIEAARTPGEEPLIRPTRARENGPIESEGYESDLPAMCVTRKDEVDLVMGH